jgi:hypothetical protein
MHTIKHNYRTHRIGYLFTGSYAILMLLLRVYAYYGHEETLAKRIQPLKSFRTTLFIHATPNSGAHPVKQCCGYRTLYLEDSAESHGAQHQRVGLKTSTLSQYVTATQYWLLRVIWCEVCLDSNFIV